MTAAVAVPLVFNPWGGNAFELPKALLLRALVLLMIPAALARALTAGRQAFRRPAAALLRPALAFELALALVAAFSINPRASLWGFYERQQGSLTLGTYLALFLRTTASLHTCVQTERLWTALVWGSAPVVAYSLLQALGLAGRKTARLLVFERPQWPHGLPTIRDDILAVLSNHASLSKCTQAMSVIGLTTSGCVQDLKVTLASQ